MTIPFLISLIFCTQAITAFMGDSQKLRDIAAQKLGDTYNLIFNSDSTLLIAYHNILTTKEKSKKENRAGFPLPPLKFFIYNIKNSQVIFEDNLSNGEVSWLTRTQVKIQTIPGTVKVNDDKKSTGYIYDVILQRKINLSKEVHQR